MSDLTKEDQAAYFEYSKLNLNNTVVAHPQDVWQDACAYKDKRIAELEEGMSKAYELIRPYRTHPGLFREVTDILEDCLQAEEMRYISEGGADE